MKKKAANAPASGAKKSSIRAKLMGLIVPAVLIMILVLIVISAYSSRKRISQMATDELSSSIGNQADNISAWMNENLADFSSIKYMIEQTKPDDKELQSIIDATYGYNSNAADGMHIGTASGQVIKPKDSKFSTTDPLISSCTFVPHFSFHYIIAPPATQQVGNAKITLKCAKIISRLLSSYPCQECGG